MFFVLFRSVDMKDKLLVTLSCLVIDVYAETIFMATLISSSPEVLPF